MKKIVFKVKELMEKKQLSQNKVSQDTGITRQTIGRLYNNNCEMVQIKTLEALTEYFDCEVGDLFDRQ